MQIIGLNHKTAPIDIREKFFLTPQECQVLLLELKSSFVVSEAFVLSTCNRVEIYVKRVEIGMDAAPFVLEKIAKIKHITLTQQILSHIYVYKNQDAVLHLMRVTCGLDSLMLGEKQILGQVKSAIDRSRELGFLSKYFNVLTQLAIRAGKKAQSETLISAGGSSISWAAIENAQEILGTLNDKSVLVIGAGKMGELALTNLSQKGLSKIYLMNRTGQKAEELALKFNGIAASFWDIQKLLTEVDVCICSVGAPHYILTRENVAELLPKRQGRPIVFIDISMPRNIDPMVGNLPGVHLRAIDDLSRAVNVSMQKRQTAILDVEKIIAGKIQEFYQKIEKVSASSDPDFSSSFANQ